MGLTKDEVVNALSQHMKNLEAPRQERQEATELRIWVQNWNEDAEELEQLGDDFHGLTENIFWAVRSLHSKQQAVHLAAQAPVPPAGEDVTVVVLRDVWRARDQEEETVLEEVTFNSNKDLKDYCQALNTAGLVPVEEAGDVAAQPTEVTGGTAQPALPRKRRTVTRVSDLHPGGLYTPADSSRFSDIKSIQQFMSHMVSGGEDEFESAVLLSQHPTDECVLAPQLRKLTSPLGQDEAEVDGVVICRDKAVITSKKSFVDTPKPVQKLLDVKNDILLKRDKPAYSSTTYAAFRGKEIVPAFMVDYATRPVQQRISAFCKTNKVLFGHRSGRAITISCRYRLL